MAQCTVMSHLRQVLQEILPPVVFRRLMALRERPVHPVWRRIEAGAIQGRELFLDQDSVGDKIVQGRYDSTLFAALAGTEIVQGDVVLDIGGHVGYHALSFAAIFPESRVISCEPVAGNLKRIMMNLEKNPDLAARVRVMPVAVGRENGNVEMMAFPSDCGALTTMGFLSSVGAKIHTGRSRDYEHFTAQTVKCIAVDTSDIPHQGRVRLMKIDVEGSEVEVIAGARKLIARDHPVLFIELHSVALAVDALRELGAMGYAGATIDDQSRNRCVVKADRI